MYNILVFTEARSYLNIAMEEQLKELDTEEKLTAGILNTLKSVSL